MNAEIVNTVSLNQGNAETDENLLALQVAYSLQKRLTLGANR